MARAARHRRRRGRGRLRSTAVATAIAVATGGVYALTAEAAVTCTSPTFKRQMFANVSFSGTPNKTDCDSAIDQNWGTGAPASGLPSNNFGVRWSVTRDFGSGGPFTLSASGLDGIRVYVDGALKINLWKNVSTTVSKSVNVTIPSGKHALRVDYVNWTGSARVKFTYTPRTSASVDTVKPLIPTGLTATYSNSTQQTKLSWSKNKEMDLAGYRVYRQVAGSGAWKQLTSSTGTTATSYTDTPPATGEKYDYRVLAFDKAGNLSSTTASVTVTSFAVTTPAGFTATGTDTGVALSWDAVPGAVRYRVVRSAEGQTSIYWLPTGTSLTDTSVARSADHTYRVAAVDASGRVTVYTTGTTTRRLVAAPTDVKAFPDTSAVTLTWLMDENEATGGDYRDFRIYRYTGTGTEKTEVTDRCDPWKRTLADGTVQHLCTDFSAGTTTAYRYVVTAYDEYGAESVPSAEVTATTGTDTAGPAAPASASATAGEGGTALTWAPVTDADLDRYSVLRGTTVTENGSTVCSGPTFLTNADVAATSYQDVTGGAQSCYVVRAVDFAGNVGEGVTVHTA